MARQSALPHLTRGPAEGRKLLPARSVAVYITTAIIKAPYSIVDIMLPSRV